MICSQCGREIADGSLSCNFCGKIFVTKRAPGETPAKHVMVNGAETSQQTLASHDEVYVPPSLLKAVQNRRRQRWVFYSIITVLVLGASWFISVLSNNNAQMVAKLSLVNSSLSKQQEQTKKQADLLSTKERELLNSQKVYQDKEVAITAANDALAASQAENERCLKLLNTKDEIVKAAESSVGTSLVLVSNLVNVLATPAVSKELSMLHLAPLLTNSSETDTDKDGISDFLEQAIGTNAMVLDTDKDGFSDLDEINKGYNPTGAGKMPSNKEVVAKFRNHIALQKINATDSIAWYISANGLRYYLGTSANDYRDLLFNNFWTK